MVDKKSIKVIGVKFRAKAEKWKGNFSPLHNKSVMIKVFPDNFKGIS
jgi:predicted membrane protein